ncbi:MAG: pilus assembly protein TadG-related protein [Actinomycetota bacterium]
MASKRAEPGFILPSTALVLLPLMIFAALAVDVGAWTVQASRTQAAADAAALAAAPLLPDEVEARTLARQIAAANGYQHGVDGVTVDVVIPRSSTVRVTITAPAERFLSNVVSGVAFDIQRHADATALAPVGMASPSNVLGFGPYSLDGSQIDNFWLLENNDCSIAHWGDIRAARYLSSPWCGDGLGLPENPRWKRRTTGRAGGYFYVVKIPPGLTSSSTLMMFDPGKCPPYGSKPSDGHWNRGAGWGTELEWRQWSSAGTPLITADDTPVSGWWSSSACAEDLPYPSSSWTDQTQGWTTTPFVFPANTSGETEYHLIQSMAMDATARGWNYYGLWVRPNNGTLSCTTIGSDSCPSIGGEDWLPTAARGAVVGEPMDLYLAEVGPEYAGRTLEVLLWDPGEGMDNIQVIAPTGESLDFTWSSDDPSQGSDNASDTCGGDPCLYLDPNWSGYAPKLTNPGWGSHWRFNGRLVTLSVPLDSQVDYPAYASSGNGYWFRIRFQPRPTARATEWASFSVQMSGDPIRLTD